MSLNAHELKGLKTRLAEAAAHHQTLKQLANEAQQKASEAQRAASSQATKMENLERQIKEIESVSVEPIVTEHAMLRFMERVYGVDLNTIRDIILGGAMISAINEFKSGKFPIEGYDSRAVVKNRTVVTVED